MFTDGIYPYVIGGMQKHSFYLAKYFALNEIYVDLYHTNFTSPVTNEMKELTCFSDEEIFFIQPFLIEFPAEKKYPGHYLAESYEYSERVYDMFCNNSDVDFIYAKGFSAWKLIDEKRKGYKCPPIGVNFHGYEMFQKPPSFKSRLAQSLFFRNPVLFNVQNADCVFSYGGKISEIILKLGVKKEKIIEISTGIEMNWIVDKIKTLGQKRKFVFVGRYERRKGIEELNRALKELIKKYDFEFHFIGNIPPKRKLFSDKIIYHDMVADSEQLKKLLEGFDILVCPSHSEGMPNVILEAMALGLAVIATDVGAVNLMVSSNTGWLINTGKKSELKKAMINAIHLPAHDINELKEKSQTHIRQNFLMDQIITKLIKHISLLK